MEKLLNGGLNLLILNRCNRQDMDILLNVELRTSFKCPHYLFNLGSKTVDIYNNNRVMVSVKMEKFRTLIGNGRIE